MSDNSNVDGVNPSGAGGATNPPVSSGSPSSVADAGTLAKLVREVIESELKPIKGEISGIYSRQDKDRNSMREFMDEFKKQSAKGLSENDAMNAAESALKEREETAKEKQMIREIYNKLSGSPSAQAAGNGASGANETAKVIEELSLDGNSPDVVSILSKGLDPERQELELRRLATRPKNQPSPAASVTGNAPVTGAKSGDELRGDYIKEMRAARGKPNDIRAIKDAYIKKGVNIYDIDLT